MPKQIGEWASRSYTGYEFIELIQKYGRKAIECYEKLGPPPDGFVWEIQAEGKINPDDSLLVTFKAVAVPII